MNNSYNVKSKNSFKIELVSYSTQIQAKEVVLKGLQEHWGSLDLSLNHDLNDIIVSYPQNTHKFLVGLYNDQIIATGALIPESNNCGRIVRMSILLNYRKKGYASELLKNLEEIAKKQKFTAIYLETSKNWKEAIQFYLNRGYKIDKTDDNDTHFSKKLE